ncbi:MAG: DUF2959 domain-containing protein [Rhodothermaceae bacterium]|nr:DUF2959 domain-containing protein [Rhodothermaceae bacterium]
MNTFVRFSILRTSLLVCILLCSASCKSVYDAAYYRTLEAFGQEKRDILVNRVDDARESQEDAKEQFSSALEQFTVLMNFDGGDLERVYDKLNTEFERSESRAKRVRDRIDDVENVANALFDEWEEELNQYTDPKLRRSSEQQLEETRDRYEEMDRVMNRAASKMDPVLDAFRDQVLFLKHNLNARAIASLEDTAAELQSDVASLINDMEASINEATSFIEEIQGGA